MERRRRARRRLTKGECGAAQRPATRRYGAVVRHSWLVGWLVLLGWLVEGSASVTLRYARPIIEITHPTFGEVIEDTAVSISARVRMAGTGSAGYGVARPILRTVTEHDSSEICLLMASGGERVFEQCFMQTAEKASFHTAGLAPWARYLLRVTLRIRGVTVAAALGSFEVGGVMAEVEVPTAGGDGRALVTRQRELVSIDAALQVAVAHQIEHRGRKAEEIYRQVLQQKPRQADALHLLGSVIYHRGAAVAALPYLELAVTVRPDSPNFLNTFGACLAAAGRLGHAATQYERALAIAPEYATAHYNLAETLEEDPATWLRARQHYAAAAAAGVGEMHLESQYRECGILQRVGHLSEAEACLLRGLTRWPMQANMHNELGNVQLRIGRLSSAAASYRSAIDLGMAIAEVNLAAIFELDGQMQEASGAYERVLRHLRGGTPGGGLSGDGDGGSMDGMGGGVGGGNAVGGMTVLPSAYWRVRIKQATMLPRIMPATIEQVRQLRRRYAGAVDDLQMEMKIVQSARPDAFACVVDEADVLVSSFSAGFFLAYHGFSDVELRAALSRMYTTMCPVLALPFRARPAEAGSGTDGGFGGGNVGFLPAGASEPPHSGGIGGKKKRDDSRITVGFVSRFFYRHSVGLLLRGIMRMASRGEFDIVLFFIMPRERGQQMDDVEQHVRQSVRVVALPAEMTECRRAIAAEAPDVLVYPELGMDPVAYFLAHSRLAPVQAVWWGHPDSSGIANVDYFVTIGAELAGAERFYSEKLWRMRGDTLGTYFLRPALGARWEVGADGVSAVADHYPGTEPEEETPLNTEEDEAVMMSLQRRTRLLLARFGITKQIGIGAKKGGQSRNGEGDGGGGGPGGGGSVTNTPLYFVAQALFKFHPAFVAALANILLGDPKGHLLLIRPAATTSSSRSWAETVSAHLKTALLRRVAVGREATAAEEAAAEHAMSRVHWTARLGRQELLSMLKVSDVVLDTFPFGGGVTSLQTLAMGTPLVTLPSKFLRGRLTLGLYRQMGCVGKVAMGADGSSMDAPGGGNGGDSMCQCVAGSEQEYVERVLALGRNAKLRAAISAQIEVAAPRLFEDISAVREWEHFFRESVRARGAAPEQRWESVAADSRGQGTKRAAADAAFSVPSPSPAESAAGDGDLFGEEPQPVFTTDAAS